MAERRMFAKQIIDSDAFLDMPNSSQALYFHLGMRGDDEGFVNNPKKIQRMIGANDDDMRILISKKFIIPFESGVCVIKHWKIHNYIRADRLINTVYQDERKNLSLKNNGIYKMTDICQADVRQMSAEVRLGKVSKNHCVIDMTPIELPISLPTKSRFDDFWKEYPSSQRKVAKATCEKKWQAKKLSLQADEIIAHIRAIKNSQQWKDGFAPAPLTYINQERWHDEIHQDESPLSDELKKLRAELL